jgi:hypothetical protein
VIPGANISFGGSGTSRTVTVTPAANKYGTATITVQVTDGGGAYTQRQFTVTVNSVNDNPVAGTDYGYRYANQPLYLYCQNLVGNDTDVDGDFLSLSSVNTPSNYGASVVKNGDYITYTAPAGFNSTDWFTYTVSDGHGGTATGTVYVYVMP